MSDAMRRRLSRHADCAARFAAVLSLLAVADGANEVALFILFFPSYLTWNAGQQAENLCSRFGRVVSIHVEANRFIHERFEHIG